MKTTVLQQEEQGQTQKSKEMPVTAPRDEHQDVIANFEWLMSEYTGNIYISDMETYELLFVNKHACETLQGKAEEFVGRKCYEVIQGRNTPCPFCTNSLLKRDEVYEWEFDNPNLKKTFMIKNKIIDWQGRQARIELSHDMVSTEYKLAKKDRERDAIIRTIPGGFARVDARDMSTILWYGGGFLDLIGYTKEQFEDELHSQCTYVHPDDLARAVKVMQNAQSSSTDTVTECRVVTFQGEIKILTMTFSYVSEKDSWDGLPSFYSVGIDVTRDRIEQSRQRKALEEAYETSKLASEAKSNFLSSMSHDIRTPMNAIIGMATIAQANLAYPEKIDNCLTKIQLSSRHLLNLINEVLDMSKIESGKIDLTMENVDLSELVQNVYEMSKPLAAEKNQELKIFVDHVSHEKVITDGDRLHQILMNLLSNAIKYTPEGGHIQFQIRETRGYKQAKGYYEFIFTDDGIGISEQFLPHLFEPFSREQDSRINKIQGTGLGLAITDNIVRMMNGTIEVHSQLNQGSQFIVTIPLEVVQEEEEKVEELIGCSVLVADDDEIVCENAVLLLGELGIIGKSASSGYEAVQKIQAAHETGQDFFAVILDWKMPGMDGLETIRIIRNQLWDKIPIIVISAYDLSEIEDDMIKAGADAFISKPLFKSKILHVLELFCTAKIPTPAEIGLELKAPDLCGRRILLAEDNELNREIAVELLSMHGLLVDTAENGAEAVHCFEASAPGYYTAVLMDIQMPVMDGYQATAVIRRLPRQDAKTLPIIALSANVFVTDVKSAQAAGMNDHIAKPIDIDGLIAILRQYI